MKIIYLRKSRADGEHETVEEILERHEKMLQGFAVKAYGAPIPEEQILREVVSGETIDDRPQMHHLLELLQTGSVEAVLVVDPQRLSRGDLRDCGTVIRAFQYTGTLVATPQKIYDLTDKFDRKFLEMELMRGNDYLEYVKEIMLRGRLASVSEGNFIGSSPPFGYDKVKAGKSYTLAENRESDAVRLIFDMYVNQNMGYAAICSRLDELGVKPRKKDYWVPASIKDILENPVYIGKIRWNWRKTVKQYRDGEITKARPKAAEENWILVDGKHPALISEELFTAAQTKRGTTPRIQRQKALVNPFAGLCRCECGSAMVLRPSNKAQLRIMCQHQTHCHNKSALYTEFEEAVVQSLYQCIVDLEAEYATKERPSKAIQENLIATLRRDLIEIERQQEKLYDLLERGIYTDAVFLQRNAALADRRESTEAAIRQASIKMTSTENIEERIVKLKEAIACIQSNTITPKAKNDFLKTVIISITYSRPISRYDKDPFILQVSLHT